LGFFNIKRMQKINFNTVIKKMSADLFTPVGIYLRLRDQFRDSVLLESTDFDSEENSFSFIGVKAIAGIEYNNQQIEYRQPTEEAKTIPCPSGAIALEQFQSFFASFVPNTKVDFPMQVAQGLLGYMGYNAVALQEAIPLQAAAAIPVFRFRFYQYIIAINHFKDELYIIENQLEGIESELAKMEMLITKKDVPQFPFTTTGVEQLNCTDADYMQMVEKGIAHCKRGDVFQVVLSRKFQQSFIGDEFNVYRALRNINPSPYLFYFDYGDYRLFGSSPESQLIIKNNKAIVHPIAGTVRRTGNNNQDIALAKQLVDDPKENAEHIMLVDLARNDLSRFCTDVAVAYYKKLKHYSHLIHLVSEVHGITDGATPILEAIGKTFPAGTLSGAPKYRAMEIINTVEKGGRGFYGGAIGILGFDNSCNMAILIRSFLSKDNHLYYQAGAGIVAHSKPQNELQEVENKIAALRAAIALATKK
jgi:anthranilate synthase component I